MMGTSENIVQECLNQGWFIQSILDLFQSVNPLGQKLILNTECISGLKGQKDQKY